MIKRNDSFLAVQSPGRVVACDRPPSPAAEGVCCDLRRRAAPDQDVLASRPPDRDDGCPADAAGGGLLVPPGTHVLRSGRRGHPRRGTSPRPTGAFLGALPLVQGLGRVDRLCRPAVAAGSAAGWPLAVRPGPDP